MEKNKENEKKIRKNSYHVETKQRARSGQPSKCPSRHPTDKGANSIHMKILSSLPGLLIGGLRIFQMNVQSGTCSAADHSPGGNVS